MIDSLWGEEFNLPDSKEKTKKIVEKVKKPKEVKIAKPEKVIKSKTISLKDKLDLIEQEVKRVLGKQLNNVLTIKTFDDYQVYIDACIANGFVAVDTETNNSLDPITCKLMGLCLYIPGQKQAYIPVNHRNYENGIRLDWQLTEEQIAYGLNRLIKSNTKMITHNGKFDYQVLKCTCGVEIPIYWDTMIGFKLIDENERSVKLKALYSKFIDPEQEKYNIEELFDGVEYADVDPDIFALYSATDSFDTYKMYDFERDIITSPDYAKVYDLFTNIEMPCVIVTAEMELAGVEVDQEYAERLKKKYHDRLDALDEKTAAFLNSISGLIDQWRKTPEANQQQWRKQTDKQYANARKSDSFDETLWKVKDGSWYKLSKSKAEQLDEVITPNTLGSPVQLGIILYDILKCPFVNKEKPYATGEEELNKIKNNSPLCGLVIQRRELVKLITGYIDNIPELAKRWPDGRVRTHFNQYGAATGRFSSSDPINLQNIPSHNKELRMLFKAQTKYESVNPENSKYELNSYQDVFKKDFGWVNVENLTKGDLIQLEDDEFVTVKDILHTGEVFKIYV